MIAIEQGLREEFGLTEIWGYSMFSMSTRHCSLASLTLLPHSSRIPLPKAACRDSPEIHVERYEQSAKGILDAKKRALRYSRHRRHDSQSRQLAPANGKKKKLEEIFGDLMLK